MPPRATVLHRLARHALGPVVRPLGFVRMPGTSAASWLRPEGARWLVTWVQPSPWNAAGMPGYSFTLELRWCDRPVVGASGPFLRLSDLMTVDELEDLRRLENAVIAKLPPPDPDLLATLKPSSPLLQAWQPRLVPYEQTDDVWFRYQDEEDIGAMLALIGWALPGAVERFVARGIIGGEA